MPDVLSLIESCVPRDDVLAGRLADHHFAAQLDAVVRRPSEYPVYGDPDAFFALTHPTEGLRRLLEHAFGRVSGASVPGAEHGVIRLETSFGGGKTHNLIAVYHLASGARPANLAEFVRPELLPGDCQVAAVVADSLDPASGVTTDGITSFTLWGALAAQLGPTAFEAVRRADEQRSAPGKESLERMCGGRPTVLIVDEIAAHLRQLKTSGHAGVRAQASAVPFFIKALTDVAAGNPNVVLIITLAGRADAFAEETAELNTVLDETLSVLGRSGEIVTPASDEEIVDILKRRLFASISTEAAREVAAAYHDYYETVLGRGESLSGGAEAPGTYAERIARSYPFHPELVRVLDQRIGTIPEFQRARGALKLLAEVVAGAWRRDDEIPAQILNVADIDLGLPAVRDHLTIGLQRPAYAQVAAADIVGPGAHAQEVDRERFAGRRPMYCSCPVSSPPSSRSRPASRRRAPNPSSCSPTARASSGRCSITPASARCIWDLGAD